MVFKIALSLGQFFGNKIISVQYAFKKDSKGERHGSQAERLLAANRPLASKQLLGANGMYQEMRYRISFIKKNASSSWNDATNELWIPILTAYVTNKCTNINFTIA